MPTIYQGGIKTHPGEHEVINWKDMSASWSKGLESPVDTGVTTLKDYLTCGTEPLQRWAVCPECQQEDHCHPCPHWLLQSSGRRCWTGKSRSMSLLCSYRWRFDGGPLVAQSPEFNPCQMWIKATESQHACTILEAQSHKRNSMVSRGKNLPH